MSQRDRELGAPELQRLRHPGSIAGILITKGADPIVLTIEGAPLKRLPVDAASR
jgi:hypothetical protein